MRIMLPFGQFSEEMLDGSKRRTNKNIQGVKEDKKLKNSGFLVTF